MDQADQESQEQWLQEKWCIFAVVNDKGEQLGEEREHPSFDPEPGDLCLVES